MNPLDPRTPETLPLMSNWARFSDGDAEFATGMGTTTVRKYKAHLRLDGLAAQAYLLDPANWPF